MGSAEELGSSLGRRDTTKAGTTSLVEAAWGLAAAAACAGGAGAVGDVAVAGAVHDTGKKQLSFLCGGPVLQACPTTQLVP